MVESSKIIPAEISEDDEEGEFHETKATWTY
jgi:hypothetical protein